MKKIVVTGERVNSKKFEVIFDMLDDGVEQGKIEYIKHDLGTKGALPEADGYIFIVSSPWGNKQNFIHILPSDSEEIIISKVQELGRNINGNAASGLSNVSHSTGDVPIVLFGIKAEIKGREVILTKDDLDCIKALMAMCKDQDFEIKEVLIDEEI
jgi:hypothetical protein